MRRKKRFCKEFSNLESLVGEFLGRQPERKSRNLVELWRHWAMVMGEELAGLAFPLGQKDEVLLIGAEDNLALQELSFFSAEILCRVNAFLEEPVFASVQLSLLQGRATLDSLPLLQNDAGEQDGGEAFGAIQNMGQNMTQNMAQRMSPRIPVAAPAKGSLGFLDLDPASPLGRCYARYVERFGKRRE